MSTCEYHLNKSKGVFDSLSKRNQETVMQMVGNFHYRTGTKNADGSVKHEDGSWGDIKITHKQMNDILAYALISRLAPKKHCKNCYGKGKIAVTTPANTGDKFMLKIEQDCPCTRKK